MAGVLRQVYPALNPADEDPPLGKIDIIAVHGLNPKSKDEEVHGWDTWKDPKDGSLWLRDELPKYVPDARIFLYIYESTAIYGSSQSTFMDRANKLLECIRIEREEDSDPTRPLILLGHSLGGLLIEQALINAHNNPDYSSIKKATTGLAFFGTPHRFKKGDHLLEVLETGSMFLDMHQEHLRHLLVDYQIRSFWGTRDSIVPRESARFGLSGQNERIISLNADHRGMCKFGKGQADRDNWKVVRSNIRELYTLALKERRIIVESSLEPGNQAGESYG